MEFLTASLRVKARDHIGLLSAEVFRVCCEGCTITEINALLFVNEQRRPHSQTS
jgi:hypothetical protein